MVCWLCQQKCSFRSDGQYLLKTTYMNKDSVKIYINQPFRTLLTAKYWKTRLSHFEYRYLSTFKRQDGRFSLAYILGGYKKQGLQFLCVESLLIESGQWSRFVPTFINLRCTENSCMLPAASCCCYDYRPEGCRWNGCSGSEELWF